jgi:hypothetical protein
MTAADVDGHRADHTLSEPAAGAWKPREWPVAPLTAPDGR